MRAPVTSDDADIGNRHNNRPHPPANAFRTAASLRPESAEALQMLAIRLSRAPRKKTRATARKIATKALKLEPGSAMGYVALGKCIAATEFDINELTPKVRDKAVGALRTALELGDSEKQVAGPGEYPPLSKARKAEVQFTIGTLVSPSNANEALRLFREAARNEPTFPAYAEAVQSLLKGAEAYRKDRNVAAAEAEKERLRQLEEEEDAAWDEDGIVF